MGTRVSTSFLSSCWAVNEVEIVRSIPRGNAREDLRSNSRSADLGVFGEVQELRTWKQSSLHGRILSGYLAGEAVIRLKLLTLNLFSR
jgi:hypothetical protein